MTGLGFTIGDPVDAPPPMPISKGKKEEQDWSSAYRATRRAGGLWVPIACDERVHAKNLSLTARRRHGFQAVVRGSVCFLRAPQ